MGMLSRIRFSAARMILPKNALTSADLANMLRNGQGYETDGGEMVTTTKAMQFADVHACVKVVSEDIAALPYLLYKRVGKNKERVTDHWLFTLLRKPNDWQDSFQFREMQQSHLELCGNFYALKTVVREEVRELLPISPDRMHVEQDKNTYRLKYTITWLDGTTQVVPQDRVYHVRGLSLNGFTGVNPIEYHRQVIGSGIQTVKFGNKMFQNGALLGGVLEMSGTLSDEAAKRMKESFDEKAAGVNNAHKTVLLEEGVKYTANGIKAIDAEFMNARKFTRSQIAGLFRVPPHMIGDLERATFSNIEEQARGYVAFGLLPRLRRIEAVANLSLLPLSMQKDYVLEHLVEGLLRAKTSERFAMYQSAVQTGWMSRNEVREKENMNPGPSELDKFLDPQFLTGAPSGNADAANNDAPAKDAAA